MTFESILFERTDNGIEKETSDPPSFFPDLNLDQIIDAVTAGREEYNLKPYFYTSLTDVHTVEYRQEVFRDLENRTLFKNIEAFAQRMHSMRKHLVQADKLYYKYQKERWFLDAVEIYCDAVDDLAHNLSLADLKSRGFLACRDYLTNYANSPAFTALKAETKGLQVDLSRVKYCLLIKENSITVRRHQGETDYSADVEQTFEKFAQGAVKDYKVVFREPAEMNHVEAQALELVAKLYPDIFTRLDDYYVEHGNYLDEAISLLDRELQFYMAYLEFVARFKRLGLKFCYPQISDRDKRVYDYEGFDLALARKLAAENLSVVTNDFYLNGLERVIVVSGPNQGGKTTFARTFGQLHFLSSLGCLVPGREARLFLFDQLLTHFEREEDVANLRGKLEDDLIRVHEILDQATPSSLIIMNEIFTSTTLRDAIRLSRKVMEEIARLDVLCVWVSFIDELASFNEKTVSMVSTVAPDNPRLRTYKIIRKPADGLAYALAIAEKYQLTYGQLKERIQL